jgi:hypothetical protein
VKKKFPSSFMVGELVEVVDSLDGPIEGRDILAGTLGIVLKQHAISSDYYFVHLPCGENQIMSYKWIRKVSRES